MKKFSRLVYVLIVGLLVLSLSGCGGGSSSKKESSTTTATKLMAITSTAFKNGESYDIYRGNNVDVLFQDNSRGSQSNYRYFVSKDRNTQPVTLQLEFSGTASNDVPFAVTVANDPSKVVFYFNPKHSSNDVNSTDPKVELYGGKSQKQSYSGLALSSLSTSGITPATISVDLNATPSVVVTLNSDGTATYSYEGTSLGSVKTNDFYWEISSDQPGEYWVQNGTKYFYEDELTITSADGLYIAHDVRYVPNTLTFSDSATVKKANTNLEGDNDTYYVSYYTTKAGVSADNKYIVAALPAGESNGGAPGGEMPAQPGQMNRPAFAPSASSRGEIISAMTHDPDVAYENPVLHITKPGTYTLKGSWNGQIWVDIPDYTVNSDIKTKKDEDAKVLLILDGVTVSCDVAPALVFKKVYECGPDESPDVAANYKTLNNELFDGEDVYAGAVVVIADGSTNTFTGTNVARLNDITVNTEDGYTTSDVGTYVKAQEKLYKLDGAFHSRMSTVIGLMDGATSGTLNINSDYEGLNSEMHMLINSGTINVTADDDGVNVNEDAVSVFYMEGGEVTVKSTKEDGIDSNGYVVIKDGTLKVSAGSTALKEATCGIDYDNAISIAENTYYWAAAGGDEYKVQPAVDAVAQDTDSGTQPGSESESTKTDDEKGTYSLDKEEEIDAKNFVTFQAKAVSADISDDKRIELGVKTSDNIFKIVEGGSVHNFSGVK